MMAGARAKVGGGSYLSDHDPRIILGIGHRTKLDWIEVKWPRPQHTQLQRSAAELTVSLLYPASYEMGSSSGQVSPCPVLRNRVDMEMPNFVSGVASEGCDGAWQQAGT